VGRGEGEEMKLKFAKLQGTGNDFIIVNNLGGDLDLFKGLLTYEEFAKKVCSRRTGIGADGLITVEDSHRANLAWRFHNADGSSAEMCGNGMRCFARFVYEEGLVPEKFTVETAAGIIEAEVKGKRVKVGLTEPKDWKFNLEHNYFPSDYAYGKVRAELVSNREYYKSSSNLDTLEQSQLYTKSDFTVSKLWEHGVLNLNAVYLRYLDGSTDTAYQKLPSLSFYLLDTPVPRAPFTFNFLGKATYFYRKAGGSSYRVNLSPSLKLSRWLGIFKNTSELSLLYTYYQIGGTRSLLKFSDSLKVNRFYESSGLKLSVNPELAFTYVQSKEQSSYPFYDTSDRVEGRRELSPQVELYLYSKERRLARLYLSSTYRVNDEWKEVKGDFSVSPTSWLNFKETVSFSPQEGKLLFSNTYTQISFKEATVWSNLYRQESGERINYLKWGFTVPLSPYLKLTYSQRYDLENSTDREREYSLKSDRKCWSGKLTYRWVKNYDNTIDYQILLTINLLKLGSYGYKLTGKKD
jgi:LPS-assembly protein